MMGLNELSAVELLARYRDGSLSPVHVTEAVLATVAAWEPRIHATYALNAEQALASARQSEARWKQGAPQGALDGVPVTIKENIATIGVSTPMGSAATELKPALADAPPAARLKESGAVLICKTTMPDFGMLAAASSSFHELTRNPWDLNANPGGSSSGAAAAAAAGYGPLHVGTDIGGSVRIPASFCGVFGLKPSLGRVPIDPPYPGRVAGPITRTVRDASLLMSVLSRPDMRDFMNLPFQEHAYSELENVSLRGLRIGLWLTPGYGVKVDPEVEAAVSKAAAHFQAAGAEIELISNWVQQDMFNAFRTFSTMRLRMDTAAMSESQRGRMLPLLQRAAATSIGLTAEALYAAQVKIMEMRAMTVRATHSFDYVLSPVAPHPAFAAEAPCFDSVGFDSMGDIVFTLPFNVSEQPAASINCGYSTSGLPIGLQIIGRRFDDFGVLRLSRHYEKVREPQRAYPSLESVGATAH